MLTAALSADNAVRRGAEEQLSYANGQRGFAVALAKKLSTTTTSSAASAATSPSIAGAARGPDGALSSPDGMDTPTRLMAGMLLQKFVRDRWSRSGPALLPPEDKAQVSSLAAQSSRTSDSNKSPPFLFLSFPKIISLFLSFLFYITAVLIKVVLSFVCCMYDNVWSCGLRKNKWADTRKREGYRLLILNTSTQKPYYNKESARNNFRVLRKGRVI